MKILYLHGLDGRLNDEKHQILVNYGKPFAPTIDYRKDKNSIVRLVEEFKNKDIDVIIGSSMGGFAGYHIAEALQKPALLFNPALAQRSVPQEIPEYNNLQQNFKRIVLGAQDQVVDPSGTFRFLTDTLATPINYAIHFRQDLAHRIPVSIFEEEVKRFFKQL
ncbi:MAG TPA: YqiA/YcfP family alpha/beta fold hydrolase [Flavobacteriaceae bacterium]|nr:YqiA/YcfP family alpha/beta fold hydrolase [Flavobacteriaceae bacterium]